MSIENTHYGAARIGKMLSACQSIFFIGIGGISMSALAEVSLQNGYRVGGSDRSESALTSRLKALGAEIFYGHDAANMKNYDAAVYTVAIDADNPEYLAAKQAGKPLISRSDYLGYLMTAYERRVGIAGMHGKSTCTAMCASIFAYAADPTVFCGAALPGLGNSPCVIGHARDAFVFEACEYMDSFLDFNPTLAVVLNIGMDHVDYFHSMEQIRTSFLRYAERTGKDGTLLYNADDAESRRAFASFVGRKLTFGLRQQADFTARNIKQDRGLTSFDFCRDGTFLCRITLRTCGQHNIYNALAAASAATLCGILPEQIAAGLGSFCGAARRMEYKGTCNGADVYDDYGHHPDEIAATLEGARQLGYDRVICAYQPHTYSRTAGLLEEFSNAFVDADVVLFADIYAAREENVYGVSSKQLAEKIGDKARYCGSFEAVADAIKQIAKQGDLVIVMGAGDIFKTFGYLE